VAVQIEVRAVTGVEDGVVLEDHDGGFDGVQSGAARRRMDQPTVRVMAARCASVYGLVRNVPSAAMNNESRFHRNQDGKGMTVCLGEPGDGPKKKNSTQRSRSSPDRIGAGAVHREEKPSNKEIENKRRKPTKRRMGPALMRLRGRRLRERTKEVGMALKRDSSRMA